MKNQLAAMGLFPILLAQAVYVKCVTPRLPEPSGRRYGSTGLGPALKLLILGDSAAAGVGVSTQDQALSGQLADLLGRRFQVAWTLIAQAGYKSEDALERLDGLLPETFDAVVTSLGVNDVTHGTTKQQWIERQRRMIESLRLKFCSRHVILSGIPPMHLFPALPEPLRWYFGLRAKRFNLALNKLADDYRECEVVAIDFSLETSSMASDGFHPGPPAYRLWAEQVAQILSRRLTAEDDASQ